jgi:hypothetical protein
VACGINNDFNNVDKEKVMKLTIVKIGSVSSLTKDYSGNYAWDGYVYDFKKYQPCC